MRRISNLKSGSSIVMLSMLLFSVVWSFLLIYYYYVKHQPVKNLREEIDLTSPPQTIQSVLDTPLEKRVAYAITVTKDGPFLDGAIVLGHSVIRAHINSIYKPDLVAFVTPEVVTAKHILESLNWKVFVKDLPVSLEDIVNKNYVEKMRDSGCCGASEFLKLWAYTLTDYERVVHLDMDSIVFQNMDELFQIDKGFLFTGDYNMKGRSPVPPAQGGFLVVKPDLNTFKQYQEVIRRGNYDSKGWEGSNIGNFWGGQTIQGIMPYFYHHVQIGNSFELNRCIYNVMADNPYHPDKKLPDGSIAPRVCLDGNKTCEDCRIQDPKKVKSAHFTICQKPWSCTNHVNPKNYKLCTQLTQMWFDIRADFEKSLGLWKKDDMGNYISPYSNSGVYGGMCRGYGEELLPSYFTSQHFVEIMPKFCLPQFGVGLIAGLFLSQQIFECLHERSFIGNVLRSSAIENQKLFYKHKLNVQIEQESKERSEPAFVQNMRRSYDRSLHSVSNVIGKGYVSVAEAIENLKNSGANGNKKDAA